jgi:hypothetical protein
MNNIPEEIYQILVKDLHWINGKPFWLKVSNYRKTDKPAGYINSHGYRVVGFRLSGKLWRIKAHRLRWYAEHKVIPEQLDHKNRDKDDNRIENLRECTTEQNNMNIAVNPNSKSGYIGVSWVKKYKIWKAYIRINNKVKIIGYYYTKEEAARVRDDWAKKHHGEFASLNFV